MLTQLILALVALVHAWEEWDDVLQRMEGRMNKLSFFSFLQLLAEESCGNGAGFKLTGVACVVQFFFCFSCSAGNPKKWGGGGGELFWVGVYNQSEQGAMPEVYCGRTLAAAYYCTKISTFCADIAELGIPRTILRRAL